MNELSMITMMFEELKGLLKKQESAKIVAPETRTMLHKHSHKHSISIASSRVALALVLIFAALNASVVYNVQQYRKIQELSDNNWKYRYMRCTYTGNFKFLDELDKAVGAHSENTERLKQFVVAHEDSVRWEAERMMRRVK